MKLLYYNENCFKIRNQMKLGKKYARKLGPQCIYL